MTLFLFLWNVALKKMEDTLTHIQKHLASTRQITYYFWNTKYWNIYMKSGAGNTFFNSLCWLSLLHASWSLPPPRKDMDWSCEPKLPRDKPSDQIHFGHVLVHHYHDHCRLWWPPRRQHPRNDLHYFLHAL